MALVASCAARSKLLIGGLEPGTMMPPRGVLQSSLFNVEWHSTNPGGGPPGGQPASGSSWLASMAKNPVCRPGGKAAGSQVGINGGGMRSRLADGDVVFDPVGVGVEVLQGVCEPAERGARAGSVDQVAAAGS